MFSNKFFCLYLLFIIYTISNTFLIVSGAKCSNTFNLTPQPELCQSDAAYIGNTLVIGAYQQYSNITISPSANIDYSNGLSFKNLESFVEYTITGKSIEVGCENNPPVVDKYTFNDGIYISVHQAPCVATQGYLQIKTNFVNVTVNSVSISGPGNTFQLPSDIGTYSQVKIAAANAPIESFSSYCLYDYSIKGLSTLYPHLKTIHGECASGTKPSLEVLNYQDFTDLTLASQNLPPIITFRSSTDNLVNAVPTGGIFSELEVGQDTLIATSTLCGVQTVPFSLDSASPTMDLEFVTSCPNMINVTATLPFSLTGSWTIDSETPLTFPYTLDRDLGSYSFSWNSDTTECSITRTFAIPPYKLPIRHEVTSKQYSCSNSTIQIQFIVTPGITNFPLSSLFLFDATLGVSINTTSTGVYNIPFDHKFEVSSKDSCYSTYADPYIVFFPLPKPVVQVLNEGPFGYSFETVDLYVPNYLDFTELYMQYGNVMPPLQYESLSAAIAPPTQINHVNGKFTGVPRSYSIVYQFRNCSLPIKANTGLVPYNQYAFRSPNIKIEYTITTNPSCSDFGGTVEFEIIHSTLGSLGNLTQLFNATNEEVSNIYFYYPAGLSYIYFDWVIPNLTYTQPNVTISTTNNEPTCQYAKVYYDLTSSAPVLNNYVNGKNVASSSFELQVGSNEIKLEFYSELCISQTLTQIVSSTDTFVFNYTITPLSTCNSLGSLTIDAIAPDTTVQLYSSIGDGYTLPAENVLMGGMYNLVVENTFCTQTQGTISVFVPSPNTITPHFKVIRSPTCYVSSGQYSDAIVEIYLLNSDGTRAFINYIQITNINSPQIYTNILTTLVAGQNTLFITSQSCVYRLDINLDVVSPEFTYKEVEYSCLQGPTPGYSLQLFSSNPDIKIIGIDATYYTPKFYVDSNFVNGLGDPFGGFKVIWNNGYCSKPLEYKISSKPEPSISYVATCGDYNGYIQIDDPNRFGICIGTICSDNQGRIFNTMNFFVNVANILYNDYTNGCLKQASDISLLSLFSEDEIQFEAQNESCSGSNDGTLTFSSNTREEYSYYIYGVYTLPSQSNGGGDLTERDIDIFVPFGSTVELTASSNGTDIFSYMIPGAIYRVQKTLPTNPLCLIMVSQELGVNYQEPKFITTQSSICSIDDTPSTNINIGIERVENSTLSLTIGDETSKNGTFSNLELGKTYNMKLSLMADTCRRSVETSLTIPKVVPPASSLDSTVECSSNTSSKKSNTGLIAGLVVGILGALIFGGIVGFILYKRAHPVNKPIKPELIPMETVSIFQGGKVQKLDEF